MISPMKSKGIAVLLGLAFLLMISASPSLDAKERAGGNLIGFIYDQDGTTPVEGAVVKVQNISTGEIYRSIQSDSLGIFRVEGLNQGLYLFGVTSHRGDFNSDAVLGISGNETAKLAISLTPYDQQTAAAVQDVYKEQKENGESRVGRVLSFLPGSSEVEAYIEKGLLQTGDRIHIKGQVTDFYQEVKTLKVGGSPVKKAFAGQSPLLAVIKAAQPGDIIYVTCKRGIPPIFLSPLGIAAIVAGTGAIVYGTITLTDEGVFSAFKK